MRLSLLFIILFLSLYYSPVVGVAGQSGKINEVTTPPEEFPGKDIRADFDKARLLMNNGQYQEALVILKQLILEDSSNANLNFLAGYCFVQMKQKPKALPYLEKASKHAIPEYKDGNSEEKNAPVFTYYYLGQVYQWLGRFDEALGNYRKFKSFLVTRAGDVINQKNYDLLLDAERYMDQVVLARMLVMQPVKLEFIAIPYANPGLFSSYGAHLKADESVLFFTREKINDNIRGKADIFLMKKKEAEWDMSEFPGGNLNSENNDVFCCLPSNGKYILFASDRKGDYNIFYSFQDGDHWTEPYDNLAINSGYNESFTTVTRDGNTIYFVSDRPGGSGGKDIYKIEKLGDGSWSEPVNLGNIINTPYNEDTPWISDDGNTLYFSSEGHGSMGGYDIFSSVFNNGVWSEPENYGYPVNSPANELYFQKSTKSGLGLLSSDRSTGEGIFESFALNFTEMIAGTNNIFAGVTEKPENETLIAADHNIPAEKIVEVQTPAKAVPDSAITILRPASFGLDSITSVKARELILIAAKDARDKAVRDSIVQAANNKKLAKRGSLLEQKHKEKTIRDSINLLRKQNDLLVAGRIEQEKNEKAAIARQLFLQRAIEKARRDSVVLVTENVATDHRTLRKPYIRPKFRISGSLKPCDTAAADHPARYTVQVGAGFMKVNYFNKLDDKRVCFGNDGVVRFIVGDFESKAEALALLEQIRLLGYKDAWIAQTDDLRCPCKDNDLVRDITVQGANTSSGSTATYTVQVGAGNMKIRYFHNLRQIKLCSGVDGINRFVFGEFDDLQNAEKVKNKLVEMGYTDAWIPEINASRFYSQISD